MNNNKLNIVHELEHNRFSIAFPNGELAVLEYNKISPDKLDYCHTFVPPSKRGRGVADILGTEAMNYVANNNLKVKLTCSYLSQTWLTSHPEYRKYVL